MLLYLACSFTNYSLAWIGITIYQVGSVNFKGNTYHLARIEQYDESDNYYLGICTSIGLWCKFHEIFNANPGYSNYYPNNISLITTKETMSVKVDKVLVYTYYGTRGICTARENEMIYCPVNNP
jgi:hypothetical protein